jgi:hypothetical protein
MERCKMDDVSGLRIRTPKIEDEDDALSYQEMGYADQYELAKSKEKLAVNETSWCEQMRPCPAIFMGIVVLLFIVLIPMRDSSL